jgi:DNA adenine methylase
MTLRPVIKAKSSRQKAAEWIVSRLPPDYREMSYLEPFLGDGSVLLAKDPSAEELVSDSDRSLASIWRALRDEHALFSSRLRRMNHSKSTFERCLGSSGGDYMDEAVREFALRQMSRSAEKSVYLCKPSESKCGDCWCDIFERIPRVHERIKEVFILDKSALEVIKNYDHDKCLLFCDPPAMDATNSDFHSELGQTLNEFRGKAVVVAKNTAMYRRIYAKWNRKSLPTSGGDSIWTNF